MLAGFGIADITPEMGIQIAGDIGRPRPTREIRDPLYAKAAVFEHDGTRVCLLVLDVLAISHPWSNRIRDEAHRRFGIPREAVMVHVTQTHSAPSVGSHFCLEDCTLIPDEHPWLRGGDDRYNPVACEGALTAIEQAVASLAPATLRAARDVDSRVAFNRRFVMRDGTSTTHAKGGRENILHAEGPTDPEVAVVSIVDADGQPRCLLLHHTCHPTHGYPKHYISADWCGDWATMMHEHLGKAGAAPLVINGCCGNIAPNDHMNRQHQPNQQQMAECLTETAAHVLGRTGDLRDAPVRFASKRLAIPIREVDAKTLADARQLLADHPTPWWRESEPEAVEWDWLYAVGRLEVERMRAGQGTFDYEVQAFRIGDLAVLALVGEPFVEAQLQIKLKSPAALTLVAHMSNGYVGYIPTKYALEHGGYETWTGFGSKLCPDALDMITQTSTELLGELFAG